MLRYYWIIILLALEYCLLSSGDNNQVRTSHVADEKTLVEDADQGKVEEETGNITTSNSTENTTVVPVTEEATGNTIKSNSTESTTVAPVTEAETGTTTTTNSTESTTVVTVIEISESDLQAWENFKKKFDKSYDTAEQELKKRNVFVANLRLIEQTNSKFQQGLLSYREGVNQYSDMTSEEFNSAIATGLPQLDLKVKPKPDKTPMKLGRRSIPASIDWRKDGVVTAIQNQGRCGSSWVFATVASVESQWQMVKESPVKISEQQLMDCVQGQNGCSGGDVSSAFHFLLTDGVNSASYAPFLGKEGKCSFNPLRTMAKISGYFSYVDKEVYMYPALSFRGPITVSVNANCIMRYQEGIYNNDTCSAKTNHFVSVIGFGEENEKVYWIAKNSFGEEWGENGFFRIEANRNIAGIGTYFTLPKVEW